jgi:hypothetical protein
VKKSAHSKTSIHSASPTLDVGESSCVQAKAMSSGRSPAGIDPDRNARSSTAGRSPLTESWLITVMPASDRPGTGSRSRIIHAKKPHQYLRVQQEMARDDLDAA